MGQAGMPATERSHLPARWLLLARAAWVAVLALTLGSFVASISLIVAQLQTPCAGAGCYRWQPTPQLAADLAGHSLSLGDYAAYMVTLDGLFVLGFCAIAAVIVVRRPDEPMALFAAFTLVTFGPAFSNTTLTFGLSVPLWWWTRTALACLGWSALFVFFYLFPDGRFVPRWAWWAAVGWVVSMVFSYLTPPGWRINQGGIGGTQDSGPLFAIVVLSFFASVVVAQVHHRYRRVSTPTQRQQTKWVVYGFVAAFGGLGANILVVGQLIDPGGLVSAVTAIFDFYAVLLLLPLSIGVAILRHRLWDIDIIINRTLVYGALTACVVGIYVLVVGYLGALLRTDANLFISLLTIGVVAVLFQPLRERLQRGINRLMYGERDDPYAVLSRLGQRLETTLAPDAALDTIVETVAQALKLPYAAISLQGDAEEKPASRYGTPTDGSIVLPLAYQKEPVGTLILSPRARGEEFSPSDHQLLEDLARQIGVAVHAVRLTNDLQRSRERLVAAREEERRRLRRDLHDGLGPQLAAQTLKVGSARSLYRRDPAAADALLAGLESDMEAALTDIRRLVYNLRPPALDELGLVGAIREAAASYATNELRISVDTPESLPDLPAAVEVAAYRIAQEALTNVVRHAHAGSCLIHLSIGSELKLEITDDGVGLPADRTAGVGHSSMRERAAELGGECSIQASPTGGTRVLARMPLPSAGCSEAGESLTAKDERPVNQT